MRAGVLHIEELPMADDRSLAYQIISDAGPVVRDAHGAFLVTGASAADYVLRHPDLFSSARAFDSLGSPIPIVPVASDPPEHARYRQLLRPFFTARGLSRWLPVVRAHAIELIDRLATPVTPPRIHRHRYFGVLAPNSPLRAAVTALRAVMRSSAGPPSWSSIPIRHDAEFSGNRGSQAD